jgi:signal transduction histidine kinase
MARDDQGLIFTIHDNGEGVKAKHLEKIFDMFYRATNTGVGTGLGLYICQEIIKKLQGSIDVASVFGEGTTVTIKIPLIHEPIL